MPLMKEVELYVMVLLAFVLNMDTIKQLGTSMPRGSQ